MRHIVSFRAMSVRWQRGVMSSGVVVALMGCGGGPRPSTAPAPAPVSQGGTRLVPGAATAPAEALPPIPHVTGPLAISVVYPHPDAVIETRDSNFILGSVGSGDATLTINGHAVPVEPNGAFLAWLPLPDSATSRYD